MILILNLGHKRQYTTLLILLLRTSALGALSLHVRILGAMKPLCWDYTETETMMFKEVFQILVICTFLLKGQSCESTKKERKAHWTQVHERTCTRTT